MKTNLLHKSFFIICAMMFASFISARAQTTNSTWAGQTGDNWSDASKWNPAVVPNNSGSQTFNVTDNMSDYPGINLDINVTITSLTLAGDGATVMMLDHNFSSASTDLSTAFAAEEFGGGVILALAQSSNVFVSLGNLANFSGTTITSGNLVIPANPGLTSTVQFNGADIRTNGCDIQLAGPGSRLIDQNGNDALRNLQHNLLNGKLELGAGRNFTTGGSLVHEGEIDVLPQPFDQGSDVPTTLTINGDYTGVGFPDDGNIGIAIIEAPGPNADGKMIINGALTNYDANSKTLNKTWFQWMAAQGRNAIVQVMGGKKPLDIVTSKAALQMYGPNTGLRDKFGNDALRNLGVSARLLMGDRDFTTVDSFTSTNRLSIYGNSNFTVNGHLTINAGRFEVSAQTGYAHQSEAGFPNDPPYKKSNISVRGSLNLMSGINCRFDIFDNATLPNVTIGGAAILNGLLQFRLLDGANPTSSDTFTLLTAAKIVGQFSNVASGGRVTAISFSDGSDLGTFLVTINKKSVVLSDFQHN